MAKATFQVEVLTPEGEVFNEQVEMLSTRTTVGSLGVLANHTPLLGMLEPTALDVAELRDKLSTATAEAEAAEPGTEAQRRALRDKRRWEAFLEVAGADSAG